MLIAFDTATSLASVALINETGVLGEFTWRSHRDHSVQLLPMAHQLLSMQKLTTENLTGVAVATGPGSFNGLRVGVSAAKGLALALELPIFGITCLDALAHAHSYLSGSLCTIIEAGRGRLGIGFYKVKGGTFKQTGDYQNVTLPELVAQLTSPTFIVGELTPPQIADLQEQAGKNALLLPAALGLRRSGYLASLAWAKLQSGSPGDNLADLQPVYLHQPVK